MDTVAKDAKGNIKIYLRPLVLEDMSADKAADIILALYETGESLGKGEIKDIEKSGDDKIIYDLRKEAHARIQLWETDWEGKLSPMFKDLNDDALSKELAKESIIDEEIAKLKTLDADKTKWSGKEELIVNLWTGFIGMKDDKESSETTRTEIRATLIAALNKLYGTDSASGMDDIALMNFILNEFRVSINNKMFLDGVDIIKEQHRGVAERSSAREAFGKGEEDKAKELLLQAEGLEIEAIRLGLTAMAMMAIGLAGYGKRLSELIQSDYNKLYGVVPIIVAGGEGSRRSPDNQMNKSFD